MPKNKETTKLNLRSEEVQEILGTPPSWIVRWGITMIFVFVCILIALTFIIKYPDFVSAKVLITTKNPTEKVVARSSGQIEQFYVQNGQTVAKNKMLAVIKSLSKYEDLKVLINILDTIALKDDGFDFPVELVSAMTLGDIEPAYLDFEKHYLEFKLLTELYPYQNQLIGNKITLGEIKKQLSEQLNQKKILEAELNLKNVEFNRYRQLFEKGVISQQEFESKELNYLQAEKNLNNTTISISQMREALSTANRNLRATYIEKELEYARGKKNLLQSFNTLKKAINNWKYRYVLSSSINGIVSFNEFWGTNQEVAIGDVVFTILPEEKKDFVGRLTIASQNAGKINTGQKVLVKLDNYPYQQYGMLIGQVKNISISPDARGNYIVYISLGGDLQTSYKKDINFTQEMLGTAEIITEDLSVAERLFYKIKGVFKY
ncbi:HlyD family efflux transporter periplasmic adaptor subunit [Muricauda sp. JGD-17]|uniref:HlyD family efflux transporter periplasmic adaptor subunit n=1 Tax=Flagellimonas ochracea TaxID=2696472 RepID=A0A964WYA1_9FLAO|nr:HlyD family efflux transporter periplasmic adaptor subunit [Allomuricauda ochracea]NAY93011.1 HlyD family efflux transporter periplasmic adaptor subunit [Allomuricauda ochracea]